MNNLNILLSFSFLFDKNLTQCYTKAEIAFGDNDDKKPDQGGRLVQQADIIKVRASVHQQCGRKVLIQLDKGRNKVDVQEGIIQNAYPSVFTILVNEDSDENVPQLLSFSYSDIITRDIRMKLC